MKLFSKEDKTIIKNEGTNDVVGIEITDEVWNDQGNKFIELMKKLNIGKVKNDDFTDETKVKGIFPSSKKKFYEIRKNVNQKDLEKIEKQLPKMNKGKIKEVWKNVLELKDFVQSDSVKFRDKITPIAALLYLISPIDAIPDMVPVIGLLDDFGVIMAVFNASGKAIDTYKQNKKRREDEERRKREEEEKRKRLKIKIIYTLSSILLLSIILSLRFLIINNTK